MMERSIGPVWIGSGITLALIVAVAATAALKFAATPDDYAARLDALERKVSRAERLAAQRGDSGAYAKGAVCEGLAAETLGKARQDLDAAASAEGLQGLQMALGEPTSAGGRIAPLPLSLRVEGPYEKIVSLMDRLGRGAPTLFVDSADLVPAGAGVQLSLSGRVFCWTGG